MSYNKRGHVAYKKAKAEPLVTNPQQTTMSSFATEPSTVLDKAYIQWAEDNLQIERDQRLEIRVLDEDERGIFTVDMIPKDTTLAKIPFNALLTVYSAKNIPELKTWISNPQVQEDDLLSVLLLYHQLLGSSSRWQPHIQLLPKQYHSVINYNDEELEKIKGCNLYVIAVRWKEQVRDDYQRITQFIEQQIAKQPSHRVFFDRINLTYERYLWGLSCIWSRFISIQYSKSALTPTQMIRAMVPLIDLLNHRHDAKIGHHFLVKDNHFHVFTGEDLPANQEIFLSYGNVTNARLLMLYGFTSLTNPYDSVIIYASMNPEEGLPLNATAAQKSEQLIIHKLKCKILENHRILPASSTSPSSSSPMSFPLYYRNLSKELMIFLRLQHVTSAEMRSKFSFINENISTKLSKENELKALTNLRDVLQGMQQEYNRSVEEDESELATLGFLSDTSTSERKATTPFIPPKHHNIHSLILTYSEKKILKSVLAIIQDQITTLEQ